MAMFWFYLTNKRDIFDSIVERMIQIDAKRAKAYRMPVEQYDVNSGSYENTSLEDIQKYTIEQLKFWTEDEFAVNFRRMLTLEQYRNAEMAELYSQCIIAGYVILMITTIYPVMSESEYLIHKDLEIKGEI